MWALFLRELELLELLRLPLDFLRVAPVSGRQLGRFRLGDLCADEDGVKVPTFGEVSPGDLWVSVPKLSGSPSLLGVKGGLPRFANGEELLCPDGVWTEDPEGVLGTLGVLGILWMMGTIVGSRAGLSDLGPPRVGTAVGLSELGAVRLLGLR